MELINLQENKMNACSHGYIHEPRSSANDVCVQLTIFIYAEDSDPPTLHSLFYYDGSLVLMYLICQWITLVYLYLSNVLYT